MDNTDLARAGLEAFNRGDMQAVLELIHPKVEMHVSPRMMNAGTWHGIKGYVEGVSSWNDAWENLTFEVIGIEEVDERNVVVEVHQTAVGRESGVPVEMDAVLLFEVVEGRARRFHVHPDRESALAAI
jgi:ketosteroid isomerase-like protein